MDSRPGAGREGDGCALLLRWWRPGLGLAPPPGVAQPPPGLFHWGSEGRTEAGCALHHAAVWNSVYLAAVAAPPAGGVLRVTVAGHWARMMLRLCASPLYNYRFKGRNSSYIKDDLFHYTNF